MSPAPTTEVERKIRIAVVMYGGVSLAVYMNGASQELLHLVRATALDGTGRTALFTDDELGKAGAASARVYREIARLPMTLASPGAPATPDANAIHQRFVIDILSGTSAGGINAIFLAKAMANGQSMDNIARLWETEGDLDKLINDRASLAGTTGLPSTSRPGSLLNSHRMFQKLREAFEDMDIAGPRSAPLAEEIDLFVTTTDIGGLPVRLQLGGGEVAVERKYRQVFHLRYGEGWNEFTPEYNEFLAFCARCTSSFPMAFEPMQLRAMNADQTLNALWSRHFDDHREARLRDPGTVAEATDLLFGDGGYLDNKPFGYAIDAIAQRRGGDMGRVERKLIYIDPDPERLIRTPASPDGKPHELNAVEGALFALNVPRYETIREELLRLRDRNRVVDKVTSVVRGVDDDFERLPDKARQDLADVLDKREEFQKRKLSDVIAVFGASYGGCHRLKVAQLTDDLSEAIASAIGVRVESDEYRSLRLLVSKWRSTTYVVNPVQPDPQMPAPAIKSEFALLEDYDLAYRIRRLSFVLERANQLRSLAPRLSSQAWQPFRTHSVQRAAW